MKEQAGAESMSWALCAYAATTSGGRACIMHMLLHRFTAFAAFLLLAASGAAQAVTVTASPNTCANVAGIGIVAWGTPGNAVSSNASYATAVVDGTISNYLQCTNYGFAIPAGATITGVTVNVTRRSDSTSNGGSQDAAMRLVKAGTPGTTDRSTGTIYTTSSVIEAHGSATDLWGTTWTPADINATNFGAAFAATKANGTGAAQTVSVDFIQITVDYTVPFSCTPPANTPGGVTLSCVCDTFGRTSLNPSTIFGANWIVSTSDTTGIVPSIVNPGYLRLTNNTGNNAKAATVPAIFPASGNYISVEFQQYAYNGSGADGIAVTLSDYATTALPGAFGGSLGYAQKTGTACNTTSCPGFAGGWIGVALDEFGNYQNPTEGRIGGPGSIPESVGIRGSGSGVTGYNWLAGTNGLNPLIDNRGSTAASFGYNYQVIVDARTPANTSVAVNRDTGGGYSSLISLPNVFTAAAAQGFTQLPVPANWQISFTGSTGGSTNIHEISGLKICAQTIAPPNGGTASGFNAIDEASGTPPAITFTSYNTGHIYTKLVGTPFKLNVAALNNNQILTTYAISSNKSVTVKLVDNSAGACVLDSTQPNYCNSACTSKAAVTGGSQTMTFISTNLGQQQSTDFTLNSAYSKLAAIISDGTTTACSTDMFSVRPTSIASVVSPDADNSSTLKAGHPFTLTATTTGGYNGIIQISPTPVNPATLVLLAPTFFPAATAGTSSSTATSASFTYGEVGSFQLNGYVPSVSGTPGDDYSVRGVYDSSWTAVDNASGRGDCIGDSYANIKDDGIGNPNNKGKYGCNFGLLPTGSPPTSPIFGRFVPDHFAVSSGNATSACKPGTPFTPFTYMGQPFKVAFTLTAQNSTNVTTQNYTGTLAHLDGATANWTALGAPNSIGLWAMGSNIGGNAACTAKFALTTPFTTTRTCDTTVAATAARVAISGTPTGTWAAGIGTFTGNVVLNRASAVDGSYETLQLGVAPQDTDLVTLLPAALDLDADATAGNERARIDTTTVRYGRIHINNAYGSQLLTLPVPLRAEYFRTGSGWVVNTDDNCTALAGSVSLTNPQGNMTLAASTATFASPLVAGNANLSLSAPGANKNGSVDVTAVVPTWLKFNWSGTGDVNPVGRATFGVYKSPIIYLRENF